MPRRRLLLTLRAKALSAATFHLVLLLMPCCALSLAVMLRAAKHNRSIHTGVELPLPTASSCQPLLIPYGFRDLRAE